jgi:DNA-binding NarL/FixJ family response regulator
MVDAAPVTIVVADDSLLIREGVRNVLERVPGVDIVAEAGDRDSALEAVRLHRPDVLLTDIRMPPSQGMEGIEIAHALREIEPDVGVVLLSLYVDATYALALFDTGTPSRGYLLKDRLSDREQLVQAIRTVAAGRAYVDPTVVDTLLREREATTSSPLASLSERERDVLALVATGLSNAAIARRLGINMRAVERRIGSIFDKLGLPDEGRLNRRVAATLAYLSATDTS